MAGGGVSVTDRADEQADKRGRHSAIRARRRTVAPILPDGLDAPAKGLSGPLAFDFVPC